MVTVYDVSGPYRGTSRTPLTHSCELCKVRSSGVRTFARGPEEDPAGDRWESIDACERCVVDALLDGLASR